MASSRAVRPPLQRRSRESLERVLAAGADVLAEKGYEGFTIGEVSRRSGVSVGAIYARAESKDALFVAVQDRVLEEIQAEQRERFAAGAAERTDLASAIRNAIEITVGVIRARETQLRALVLQAASDPHVRERGSASSQHVAEMFAGCLREFASEIDHPDPETAIDIAFRLVYGTVILRVTYGPQFESPRPVGWDELTEELNFACRRYLAG